MTRRTFTAVTSLGVQANASSAQEGISLTLINIHTILHHHESTFIAFIALAFKVPWGVNALASATEVRRYAAFINVCAVPFFRIKSEATVTPALKAADGVPALAMGAEAGNHLALIDIFKERLSICNFLRGEPGPPGTEFLVLRRVSHRTLLTFVGAPGRPHGAAAGVHAVAAGDGQSALLILVPQEAGFQADIQADPPCGIQSHPSGTLTLK